MPKKYTTDPNSGFFDEDDMPCRCDCGNWFDLNDGYSTLDRSNNTLVCQKCHLKEEQMEREAAEDEEEEQIDSEDGEDWDDEDETPLSRLFTDGFD